MRASNWSGAWFAPSGDEAACGTGVRRPHPSSPVSSGSGWPVDAVDEEEVRRACLADDAFTNTGLRCDVDRANRHGTQRCRGRRARWRLLLLLRHRAEEHVLGLLAGRGRFERELPPREDDRRRRNRAAVGAAHRHGRARASRQEHHHDERHEPDDSAPKQAARCGKRRESAADGAAFGAHQARRPGSLVFGRGFTIGREVTTPGPVR